ncbi:hypothetical protein FQA39_LY18205 [Lamprigera yunnana]|nr:hypothetical protein FQA39_LY18205 [Lamprigera yunnana]
MKFYAFVLLVVFLSVFELQSEAQGAGGESTTEGGKKGQGHHKRGNGTCGRGKGKGNKNKTEEVAPALFLI